MKNKKAQAGLDFMKQFAVGMFILVIILFVLAIASGQLRSSQSVTTSGTILNESAYLNKTGYTLSNSTLYGFSLGTVTVTNSTGIVNSGNYTLVGNTIYNGTAAEFDQEHNITYTYTYKRDTGASTLVGNFSTGLTSLGSSIPTWIVLAALVVLISIIVIVVLVVNRMNTGGGTL